MRRLCVEQLVVPPDNTYPLFVAAKRYRGHQVPKDGGPPLTLVEKQSSCCQNPGLTLILLHSTSFHKETWEACLDTLFSFVALRSQETSSFTIQEAWSIECPNHGESAILNAEMFRTPEFSEHFGCEGYSRAVHRFLTRGPVSFIDRNLVGIGHSLGANTVLMIQTFKPLLYFSDLIIVEPMVNPGKKGALEPLRKRLVATARRRRDTWPSREDARLSLPGQCDRKMKEGRGKWEERVVDAFVEYGIHPTTNASETGGTPKADHDMTSFTLACTKKQEIAMYNDERGSVAPVEVLDKISRRIPVHLILGQIKDFIPASLHDILIGPDSGWTFASIRIVPDVGHLIPQEKPDALAMLIYETLAREVIPSALSLLYRTKL